MIDRRTLEAISTDVLVVGGGASGIAAACTASARGLKVTLIERYGFCGGGAVAGMSGTLCGLYLASESRRSGPEKIVFGFVDKFIATMESHNGLSEPTPYGLTFTRVHDPIKWRMAADELLAAHGVQVIYHARAIGVLLDGDRIMGARVSTKQGPVDIHASATIDASGDADLVAMADLPNVVALPGISQNPTMMFRLAGVNVRAFLEAYGEDAIMPKIVTESIQHAQARGANLPRTKVWIFPTPNPGELLCNCTRVLSVTGAELNTLSFNDLSEAEVEGRKQVVAYADFFVQNLAGCEDAYVSDIGVQVGIRQTRQIVGRETLDNAMVIEARKSEAAIVRSAWPIERHVGDKPQVKWLLDDYYEVPLGCLVPAQGEGIVAAGRCLSATNEAQASARVTAQCFAYGEAAGTLAALSVEHNMVISSIPADVVRAEMNCRGAELS